MKKTPCYIFWDDEKTSEENRSIYVQCAECFKKNRIGLPWTMGLPKATKCVTCNTIIYHEEQKSYQMPQKEQLDT